MSKLTLISTVIAATSFVTPIVFAEETGEKRPPAAEVEEVAESEEEEPQIFEAGFDFDFLSAYVWRNTVQNDEMVMQPCVWADLTYFEPFWLGFSIWQNYNLTDRRRNIYANGLDETDYNIHLGATVLETEDEEYGVDLEIGHEWYTYHGLRKFDSDGELLSKAYPNTREIYAKATFNNPFVGVYGQASWMYEGFGSYQQGMHYELGFNKEVEIVESLTLGADWNINFGDPRYLQFLYGGVERPAYDEEAGEPYSEYDADPKGGFGGTTVKVYLTWQVTDWMSLGGVLAYTGVLNSSLRDSIGDQGEDYCFCGNEGDGYPRDLLWGGLQLRITY